MGDFTVPVDMIRALGSRGICLGFDADNKVMELFTQLCIHSPILVFPSSVSRHNMIPTPHHLHNIQTKQAVMFQISDLLYYPSDQLGKTADSSR